jgi:hypothetical protein
MTSNLYFFNKIVETPIFLYDADIIFSLKVIINMNTDKNGQEESLLNLRIYETKRIV